MRSADFDLCAKASAAGGEWKPRINATLRFIYRRKSRDLLTARNFQLGPYDCVMPHWDDERDELSQPAGLGKPDNWIIARTSLGFSVNSNGGYWYRLNQEDGGSRRNSSRLFRSVPNIPERIMASCRSSFAAGTGAEPTPSKGQQRSAVAFRSPMVA
ncbi:hypothetical protein KCP73_02455 [Salmonella enterica subsp. enterica]|nr:hypothetical protein KCP73_02455 [Salmonella enterica subsp. enterica]